MSALRVVRELLAMQILLLSAQPTELGKFQPTMRIHAGQVEASVATWRPYGAWSA